MQESFGGDSESKKGPENDPNFLTLDYIQLIDLAGNRLAKNNNNYSESFSDYTIEMPENRLYADGQLESDGDEDGNYNVEVKTFEKLDFMIEPIPYQMFTFKSYEAKEDSSEESNVILELLTRRLIDPRAGLYDFILKYTSFSAARHNEHFQLHSRDGKFLIPKEFTGKLSEEFGLHFEEDTKKNKFFKTEIQKLYEVPFDPKKIIFHVNEILKSSWKRINEEEFSFYIMDIPGGYAVAKGLLLNDLQNGYYEVEVRNFFEADSEDELKPFRQYSINSVAADFETTKDVSRLVFLNRRNIDGSKNDFLLTRENIRNGQRYIAFQKHFTKSSFIVPKKEADYIKLQFGITL